MLIMYKKYDDEIYYFLYCFKNNIKRKGDLKKGF